MKNSPRCKIFIILWKSVTLIMFCFLFLSDCLNHIVFLCLWLQKNSVHHLLPWKMDLFKLVMEDRFFLYIYTLCSKFSPSTDVIIYFFLPWWNGAKNSLYVHFGFSGEGFSLWLFFFGPRWLEFCRTQYIFCGKVNQFHCPMKSEM